MGEESSCCPRSHSTAGAAWGWEPMSVYLLSQHSVGCFFGSLLRRESQHAKTKKQAGTFPRDRSKHKVPVKALGIRDLRPGPPLRAWEAPNPGVHRPELTTTVNMAQRKRIPVTQLGKARVQSPSKTGTTWPPSVFQV